ncbi:50S ribosomal protein L11 methyltransferase [Desulfospira joergensenii]|uniref:50S ribosomal protein L11 methyltransferase n=1 Tax=Desulfospira joergensenii TaxID=53329 RepID=UPI0003B4B475|nr:50S ribosomal protein L11 methyltransferase [Desulfospira joergensenii]
MKFRKVQIDFTSLDLFLAEELICNIFFSFNLKGVVCQVPLEEPDEGFGTHTLPEPEQNSITGYLPDMDSSDIILGKIKEQAEKLSCLDIQTRIQVEIVDEKEWADAWKQYFNVTRISKRIVIRPDWKPYDPEPGEIVIHLDPGMAFGTGTHPTTAMCLRQIERFIRPGNSFLDVGTGSGILMIAAAGLGAEKMTGIDTDETAVRICGENLKKNNIRPDLYGLKCCTLDRLDTVPFDLIGANIIAQVLVDIMGDLKRCMHHKTRLILSGIIRERLPDVLDALEKHGLETIHEDRMDEWVTLTAAFPELSP